MKRKSLVSLVLITSLTAWGLIVAANPAAADPGISGGMSGGISGGKALTPPSSCASPPDSPDATAATRDRFVTLWTPRVENKDWFTRFVGQASVPDDIKAEGFNDMDSATQGWLVACLVDNLVSDSGKPASQTDIANYQLALDSVIFGKKALDTLKDKLNQTPPTDNATPGTDLTKAALNGMVSRLAAQPGISSDSLPHTNVAAAKPGTSTAAAPNPAAPGSVHSAVPNLTPKASAHPLALASSLQSIINLPLVQLVLTALADLEQLISNIQAKLFTLPVLNLLSTLFYKVCAESATQPLACSVSLPIGIPVPVDVNGDHFPDVLAELLPTVPTGLDFGVQFSVTRLGGTGPLPAHIFFVYDVPFANKRLEFGYDGRASSLANVTTTQVTVKNIFQAVTGDVNVQAKVQSNKPGAVEALTFAIKDLVGGSAGHPPTEANPVAGAVQFTPFPATLTMGAHLIHHISDEDIFTVGSSTPSTVNAVIDQDTTTTSPQSHREFTALVDKLPTSVSVDVTHDGESQNISYNASSSISHVQATDTAVGDISHPGSYTRSVYDVLGVPSSVNVALTGAQDVTYSASSVIPQVTFSTQTYLNSVLQQEITAQVQGVPAQIHLTNITGDTSTITYDASSVLTSVALSMYDLTQDQTNLTATATGIPKHIQFFMVKSTGVYDLSTDTGISLITATLTRGGPTPAILPDPGVDHATILKRGNEIGVDFQLSGFRSAHFENVDNKMVVGLGLNPGGQAFDAIADLDSPNVFATAHITQLPSSITITDDAANSTYTYNASSPINAGLVIPDVSASITLRPGTDTTVLPSDDNLSAGITNIPAQISLQLDSTNSKVNWNASDTTGKVQVSAHLTAATLGLDRGLDAGLTITGIPATWTATYGDGNVDFEAPSPGIGSIDAWVTNHGTHETDTGDFLGAFFDEPSGNLDAALHISNLQRARFTKLTDGTGGGFVADLNMGNHSNFDFFATVNLGSPSVTTKLVASGSLNPLPAAIHLESDGGRIRYTGDTNPTLTLSVGAGDPTALTNIGALATPVQGIIIRDGENGSGGPKAIAATLKITGLPDSLDLNTPAGIYTVSDFNPTTPLITVDAVLNTIASEPLSIQLSQDTSNPSGPSGPVTFVFGPFVSSTDGDGTHHMSINYTASRGMGAFNAEVTYGHSDDAMLNISNIPGGGAPSISVNTAFGDTDTVDIDMTQGIDSITASYKHVSDVSFGGVVELTDVPSSVHLKLGSQTNSTTDSGGTKGATAPQFTFNASASGMNINAFAHGSIVNASAVVTLAITDMGSTITGALDGTTLNITSSPDTGSFMIDATAKVHIDVDLGFSFGPFVNTGTLGVDIDVRDITVKFTHFSSIGLALGVTTGLTGTFTSFTFGLDLNVTLSIVDKLDFQFSLPIIGDESFRLVTIGNPDVSPAVPAVLTFNNVVPSWHVQTNTFDTVFSLPVFEIPFIIECHVGVKTRPGPGTDKPTPFTLPGPPPSDGNEPAAYLLTPGVFGLSGFIMDIVGFFESPYGNDIEPDIGCS
jgi:hypothetical protein